ncbi:MAG: GNAT family N-acetyltransferase [Anaerolineae bacterium]|jgi:GNAT superfamily N-acetyltransferase|nr:GNAT family N-acetyltransferase [Anaerolineae bacterium]MBT7073151.1 GNAT family N-acetyltransferase [Anaerolineae bacterium]MBT7326623.1 GNAT family N-acetyltransferase [Anaerolineae bacterium]
MSLDIKIRSALSTDIPRLVGFEHKVGSDYVWQLDLQKESSEISISLREVRLPRPVQVKYPRDHFSLADEWKKNARTFVALGGGTPIGYIRYLEQVGASAIWVQDLVVATEARRKGVASLLLEYVGHWGLERHNRQLFVEMSSKNHPMISLVKKMGFEFSGYNDHYYATQDVALFFGKLIK